MECIDGSSKNLSDYYTRIVAHLANLSGCRQTEDEDPNEDVYTYVEQFLYNRFMIGICSFGVVGNFLNLIVLSGILLHKPMDRMERSATVGLLALAVSDLMFCVTVVPYSVVDFSQLGHSHIGFPLLFEVYQSAVISSMITSSTWLTIMLAVSRFLAACYPLQARAIIGMKFAIFSIVFAFSFSIFCNLPRFFHLRIICIQFDTVNDCSSPEGIVHVPIRGFLRENGSLETAYYVAYLVVCVIIPLIVLAYCNFFLILALRRSLRMRRTFIPRSTTTDAAAQRGGRRAGSTHQDATNIITMTLTAIVIMYTVLVSPAETSNIFTHMVNRRDSGYNLAIAIFNSLQTLNFSFNFVLYYVINVHFRSVVRKIITCRPCRFDGHNDGELTAIRSETRSTACPATSYVGGGGQPMRYSVAGTGNGRVNTNGLASSGIKTCRKNCYVMCKSNEFSMSGIESAIDEDRSEF